MCLFLKTYLFNMKVKVTWKEEGKKTRKIDLTSAGSFPKLPQLLELS